MKLNDTICLPCQLKEHYKEPMNKILIAWFKDSFPIKMTEWPRFTQKQDCLLIKNINSFDHGTYKCSAYNRLGSKSVLRVLNVADRLPVSLPPVLPTLKPPPRQTVIPNFFSGTYLRFTFDFFSSQIFLRIIYFVQSFYTFYSF